MPARLRGGWMPRNLDRRVEIAFPVLDPHLQTEIREILEISSPTP